MASVSKRQWTYKGTTKEAWVVRYKDSGGAHRSSQFDLKKDADTFRKKIEREMDDGTHIAARASRTLKALTAEYLEHMAWRAAEGQIGQPHVDAQARALAHIIEFMGDHLVAGLTWQRVEQFGKWLRQRQCKFFDRPLSGGTVNLAMVSLRRMVGYGVRRGYAASNVVPDAVRELGHAATVPIETFSTEEMRRLIAIIEDRRPGMARRSQALMRAAVYLAAMCGLRKGEILALRWASFDFSRMTVTVAHSVTNRDVLKDPKTRAGKRVVPMPAMVAAALEQWRPFAVEDDRGLIFRTANGNHITDNSFYCGFWHPLLRRADINGSRGRHRHFHALRHFAGSAWLEGGVTLPEVSRLLGHANTGITATIYAHALTTTDQQAPALEACANLLLAPPVTQELRKAA